MNEYRHSRKRLKKRRDEATGDFASINKATTTRKQTWRLHSSLSSAAIIYLHLRVREKLPKVESPSRDKGKGNEHNTRSVASIGCADILRQRDPCQTTGAPCKRLVKVTMLGEQAAVPAAKMLCLDTSPSLKMTVCRGPISRSAAKMLISTTTLILLERCDNQNNTLCG
jgi:hypothetical protein